MGAVQYTIVNARPLIDQALDGTPRRTVRLAGALRAMILGVARPAGVRPTRLVAGFLGHCRAEITSPRVPGVRTDG